MPDTGKIVAAILAAACLRQRGIQAPKAAAAVYKETLKEVRARLVDRMK